MRIMFALANAGANFNYKRNNSKEVAARTYLQWAHRRYLLIRCFEWTEKSTAASVARAPPKTYRIFSCDIQHNSHANTIPNECPVKYTSLGFKDNSRRRTSCINSRTDIYANQKPLKQNHYLRIIYAIMKSEKYLWTEQAKAFFNSGVWWAVRIIAFAVAPTVKSYALLDAAPTNVAARETPAPAFDIVD